MNTNLHYEFGNVSSLHEVKIKLSLNAPITSQETRKHTSLMILGLTVSVACAIILSAYNPFAVTAGITEPLLEAITLFKPF